MKKRLSEREGGQLLILPPEAESVSGEDGALSIRTPGSSLHPKGIKSLIQGHSPTLEKRVLCPLPASDLCRGSSALRRSGRLRLVRPDALRCLPEDLIKESAHPSLPSSRDTVPLSQVVLRDVYLIVKTEDIPQRNPVDTLSRSQAVHLMSEDMS